MSDGKMIYLYDAIEALKRDEALVKAFGYQRAIDAVMELPSAQPERKKGTWIFVRVEEAGNVLYECSECGKGDIHAPEVSVSYCWNCGADMRGEKDATN